MLQKRLRELLIVLPLALSGCAVVSANSGDQCLYFGENVKMIDKLEKVIWQGNLIKSTFDFNEDGVTDHTVLLSISKNSKFTRKETAY
jgi:hypothetical protein